MGTSSLTRDKSKTENLETQRKRRFLGVVTLAQPFSSPARLRLSSRQYPQKTSASSATSAFQGLWFLILFWLRLRRAEFQGFGVCSSSHAIRSAVTSSRLVSLNSSCRASG